MSRIRLGLTHAPCVLLDVAGYYGDLRAMLDKMVECGFLEAHERAAVTFAEDVPAMARALEAFRS